MPAAGAAAKGDSDEEEEKTGNAFPGDASAYVAKFKAKVNELIKDTELVKDCGSFQRAFFVLEEKSSYNAAKSTIETALELHLVLVGTKEKMQVAEKIKELTKELREEKGVKVNEQIM
jgi:hypothetical protein